MPFAGYDSFDACVAANSSKEDPKAYCATIMRDTEGKQMNLQTRVGELETVRKTGAVYHKLYTMDTAKAVDSETRQARFVITTASVDRDNDMVSPEGWDLTNYQKNPVVLWAHDYSAPPVARTRELMSTSKGLEAMIEFPAKGVYPFADTVFELLKGGFLNAVSVGFRPQEFEPDTKRGGVNFRKQELLEHSIVPVPANPEALLIARSKGIDIVPVLDWAEKTMAGWTHKDTAWIKTGACPTCGHEATPEVKAAVCPTCGKEHTGDCPVDDEGTETEAKANAKCPMCNMPFDGKTEICSACLAKQGAKPNGSMGAAADADSVILRLVDDDDRVATTADWSVAMSTVVKEELAAMTANMGQAVTDALARARGRVD